MIVWNAHSWPVTGVVEVHTTSKIALGAVDEHGLPVPSRWEDGRLRFLAEDVPGVGYRTYWTSPVPGGGGTPPADPAEEGPTVREAPDAFVLANASLEARIDKKTGRVVSLVLLPERREVLGPGGGNVLEIRQDLPSQWDAWNIGRDGARTELVADSVTASAAPPLSASVHVHVPHGDSSFEQEIVVTRGVPWLEIRTKADWHASHEMLKAVFDVAADADAATFEIPYGTIDRTTHPKTAAEKAKWEVWGQRWADETDRSGAFGLSLLDDAKYGYDVLDHRLALSLLRAPKYPDPGADMGEARFTYALYPHVAGWQEAKSYRRGAELNLPLRAILTSASERGTLPAGRALVTSDCDHVEIAAMKRTRLPSDPPRFVVRLVEKEGRAAEVTVTFPFPVARAWRTNLMEDLAEEQAPEGHTVRTTLGAWSLGTLVVEPVSPSK